MGGGNNQRDSSNGYRGVYENLGIDDIFLILDDHIDRFNHLAKSGISDDQLNSSISKIIRVLFSVHQIDADKMKRQKYIGSLIERYRNLNRELDRADATGGYGTQRIIYEMNEIDGTMSKFGMDSNGTLLRSISEIKDSTRGRISENIPK